MGAGVSGWKLARAVSSAGQLGVVSGTALDLILARRLQLGDPTGELRRALKAFPDARVAQEILERYLVDGGKPVSAPFKSKPLVGDRPSRLTQELLVAANFVEVYLAKEGHDGPVGINFLQKIQTPMLPSIYGAMLAGVDVVIVGAGIPKELPGVLDRLRDHENVELDLHVHDASPRNPHRVSFEPGETVTASHLELTRPLFFPVVASSSLAGMLVRRANGSVDGLVIEGHSAGGHNAPPRGRPELDHAGQPIYGPRDVADIERIRALGLPFWLAGSYGTPEQLIRARELGAAGVQVGTLFAFCDESGLSLEIKRKVLENLSAAKVFTDPLASPTGFPFKVLHLDRSGFEPSTARMRRRTCDLGYLREAYVRPDGEIGWRCPAEDPATYASKGGALEDTEGRRCLCNGLAANIGLGQIREDGCTELPLLTCGDDLARVADLSTDRQGGYSASDVIDYLLADFAKL